MMRFLKLITLCFYLILLLTGCQSAWQKPVPNADIIYQTKMNGGTYALEFLQADGTNRQELNLEENFIKPSWSLDGTILYGVSNPRGRFPYEEIGNPAYWDIKNGRFRCCAEDLPYFDQIQGTENPKNRYEVILANSYQIILFDLSQCKQIQKIVDNINAANFLISGFSYYPATQDLLYGMVTGHDQSNEYLIVKRNLKTGEQVPLVEGINPTWSPDGTQIAYVGLDGLYVTSADGTHFRRLVLHRFFDPLGAGSPWFGNPIPRWSPDGKWLVYHQCADKMCGVDQTPILKIRVSDGLQEEVSIGGKFPIWHP